MGSTVECADTELANGADHVVEAHEEGSPEDGEDDGAEERANKTFDGFLGGEFDERGTTDGYSPDVCEDVVTDDKGSGDPEPDHAFQNIVDNKVTGSGQENQ